MVVLHRLDDVRRWKLPSMFIIIFVDVLSLISGTDHCQLYRISTRCVGCGVPWRDWQRQCQMEGTNLGCLRSSSLHIHCHQLSTSKMVLSNLPDCGRIIHGRFLALRHLAAHRGFEDVWLPIC